MASEDSRARSVSGSVDPALISTDVVGSNPSECMLELASGITQIKYALSINRDIDGHKSQLNAIDHLLLESSLYLNVDLS